MFFAVVMVTDTVVTVLPFVVVGLVVVVEMEDVGVVMVNGVVSVVMLVL